MRIRTNAAAQARLIAVSLGRPASLNTNSDNRIRVAMGNFIKDDLAKVGIQVNLVPLDFNTLVSSARDKFDYEAMLLGLESATPPDPAMGGNVWRSSGKTHYWNVAQPKPETPQEAHIDALMDALDTGFTIATPAFPDNGRTVFKGYLFVGNVLLNESGMQNHPLNPMRDANLVRRHDFSVPLSPLLVGSSCAGLTCAGLRLPRLRPGRMDWRVEPGNDAGEVASASAWNAASASSQNRSSHSRNAPSPCGSM